MCLSYFFRRCRVPAYLLTASTTGGTKRSLSCAPFKMPLKFAANISTMYNQQPFLHRIWEARNAGFKAIECQFPYEHDIEDIARAIRNSHLETVLINSHPGDTKGELGFAAKPGFESEFKASLEASIKAAKTMDCKRIHIMAGMTGTERDSAMEAVYVKNLIRAAQLLEKEGIIGVIEPLCEQVRRGYFLNSYEQGNL
uniref:Putative hydroxypyruvate isomerase carbohydrate transport and metabolism n=1 Tax=Amblyomma triste TaxID=251400 RepID=A0A023G7J2_AMBTT